MGDKLVGWPGFPRDTCKVKKARWTERECVECWGETIVCVCMRACAAVRVWSCVYVCVCCPDPAGARRLYWRCNLHWSHRRAGTTMCLRSQKHTLRFVHTHARTHAIVRWCNTQKAAILGLKTITSVNTGADCCVTGCVITCQLGLMYTEQLTANS